jgi:hypothetical protein
MSFWRKVGAGLHHNDRAGTRAGRIAQPCLSLRPRQLLPVRVPVSRLRIPIRMRRPTAARETLRLSPLVKTCGADSSSVERIPLITALAEPLVLFSGRPAAEGAADARGFRVLLFFKLAIWNYDRFVRYRIHVRYYDLRRVR